MFSFSFKHQFTKKKQIKFCKKRFCDRITMSLNESLVLLYLKYAHVLIETTIIFQYFRNELYDY